LPFPYKDLLYGTLVWSCLYFIILDPCSKDWRFIFFHVHLLKLDPKKPLGTHQIRWSNWVNWFEKFEKHLDIMNFNVNPFVWLLSKYKSLVIKTSNDFLTNPIATTNYELVRDVEIYKLLSMLEVVQNLNKLAQNIDCFVILW